MNLLPDFRYTELIARLVVSGILLIAGLVKLTSPGLLTRDIIAYHVFPERAAKVMGITLPVIEITLGALLLSDSFTRPTSLVTAGLFLAFLAATASAIVRRLNLQCGCFGMLYREKLGRTVVTRDVALMILSAYVAQFDSERLDWRKFLNSPSQLDNVMGVVLTVVIAFAAVSVAVAAVRRAEPAGHH